MNIMFSLLYAAILFISQPVAGGAAAHSGGAIIVAGTSGGTQIQHRARSNRARLGVLLGDDDDLRSKTGLESGAYVEGVLDDTPAEQAGIEEGDVIVKFNDREIDDDNDLMRAIRRSEPDEAVTVEVVRDKEHKTFTVTLEEAPEASSYFYSLPRHPRVPRVPDMKFRMAPLPRKAAPNIVVPRVYGFRMSGQDEFMGMQMQELTRQLAEFFEVPGGQGVLITEVEKGSDAADAGFKAGDIIVKAGEENITDMDELSDVFEKTADNELSFDVFRKGTTVTIKMKITDEFSHSSRNGVSTSPRMRWFERDNSVLEDLRMQLNELRYHLENEMENLKARLRRNFRNS